MTLVEMYNSVSRQYEALENCSLTGDDFQRMLDISIEQNRKMELLMNFVSFTFKSIDVAMTMDPDFKIDMTTLPFFESYKQADTKPVLASGRKQLVDTSKGRKNE